jgi:hypothetical protein
VTDETVDEPVQPGRVLVSSGVEIKTAVPRFSTVARYSALPTNPLVSVAFDPESGRVVEAEILRSSGYPNVDAPILASLYRWRARGERLREHEGPMKIRLRLLLGPE